MFPISLVVHALIHSPSRATTRGDERGPPRAAIVHGRVRLLWALRPYSRYSACMMDPREIPVLTYHRIVGNDPRTLRLNAMPAAMSVSESHFEAQMRFIAEHRTVLTLSEVVELLGSGRSAPDDACALTFDDGFIEHERFVAPLLARLGFSATFFLVTECSGPQRRVRWLDMLYRIVELASTRNQSLGEVVSQPESVTSAAARLKQALRGQSARVRRSELDRLATKCEVDCEEHVLAAALYVGPDGAEWLARCGMTIGAHTVSHGDLGKLSPDEAEREVVESIRVVRNLGDREEIPFAFPFGGAGTYTRAVIDVLRTQAVYGAWISELRQPRFDAPCFELGRVPIEPPEPHAAE